MDIQDAMQKFCLIETDEGVNLLFSPKLEQLDLNQFSEEEKQLLLSGKAIVADIMESNENDAASFSTYQSLRPNRP